MPSKERTEILILPTWFAGNVQAALTKSQEQELFPSLFAAPYW